MSHLKVGKSRSLLKNLMVITEYTHHPACRAPAQTFVQERPLEWNSRMEAT